MRRRATSQYIAFGTALRYMQDASPGDIATGETRHSVRFGIFLSLLDELGLVVTSRAARAAGSQALLEKVEGFEEGHHLTAEEATEIHEFAARIRPTLFAEAAGHEALFVSEKRMDVEKLLDNVAGLFAPGMLSKVPSIAQLDFEEAGKCVAFERPTAAAFHLMRGTESSLRAYYCARVKRGRVDPLLWGPMVDHLRQRRDPPPAPLLDNLDAIRRNFRNPTQHPEATYEIDEAQDLFGIAIDVVNRMARELPEV